MASAMSLYVRVSVLLKSIRMHLGKQWVGDGKQGVSKSAGRVEQREHCVATSAAVM